nr:hypothetical protein [Tanacetum cinerariifolium]
MLKSFPLPVMKLPLPKIQQYLQNEHYALWEVIEFGDSYEASQEESGIGSVSKSSAKNKGRTVAITNEDMQKRRNDFKARTTLLLALPDEHQLRFSKYKTAQELNRNDLDTLSLDDVYNHLKVYKPEVQKKSESNSQNMAFISSANTSSIKGEVNTAASQSNGSQIKYKDINQIDEDDIEEIDIKWNMALLKEDHALVADDEALTEFALMAKSSSSFENEYCSPPPAQVYSPPKKDMSSTGLPEFADDTITDYNRPSPSIESNSSDLQNSNSSVFEHEESSESIMSNPMIKFVKAADSPTVIKTNKVKAARKPSIKYAEMAISRIILMIKDIRTVVALGT